jgi:hypothetical protein
VAALFGHLIEVFSSRPPLRFGEASREAREGYIPPMLARLARSGNFPSGPSAGFHEKFDHLFWEVIQKSQKSKTGNNWSDAFPARSRQRRDLRALPNSECSELFAFLFALPHSAFWLPARPGK